MNLYSYAFKIVQQYNRSGANIGVLFINRPDIMAFIHMKDDLHVMNKHLEKYLLENDMYKDNIIDGIINNQGLKMLTISQMKLKRFTLQHRKWN